MMPQYDLLSAWFRVADWCAYDLLKDGYEALVLQPLGTYPKASETIVRLAGQSDNYMHRKVTAELAGWTIPRDPHLLDEIFLWERTRDKKLPEDDGARLECQSVVEDIVFAASRWARHEQLQDHAYAVLTDVVQRTIEGEYWNTSSYAITTLIQHSAAGADTLLNRFKVYSDGKPPTHVSNPSLEQERAFADNLISRNPATLTAIENILREKDETINIELDENSRASIDNMRRAAREFERIQS